MYKLNSQGTLYSIEIEVSKYVHCYVETVFFM